MEVNALKSTHASPPFQVPLKIPVEVLVRCDIEEVDAVGLRFELVGQEKLLRPDLELHDPDALEAPSLRLATQRVLVNPAHRLIDSQLPGRRQAPLRLREARRLNEGARGLRRLTHLIRSRRTDTVARARP